MSDLSWLFDVEKMVFSILKTKATEKLKTKYPDITFTTSDKNTNTKFPTVLFKAVTGNILGTTFENGVEGVQTPFQIDVFSDKSQTDASYVMEVVAEILTDMGFHIVFPSFNNETTVYRCTMRVTRVYANNDTI